MPRLILKKHIHTELKGEPIFPTGQEKSKIIINTFKNQ